MVQSAVIWALNVWDALGSWGKREYGVSQIGRCNTAVTNGDLFTALYPQTVTQILTENKKKLLYHLTATVRLR